MGDKGRFDSRYSLTILGMSVLLGAVLVLTNGDRQSAVMGFILGGAIVVWNEWWQRRKRHRDD